LSGSGDANPHPRHLSPHPDKLLPGVSLDSLLKQFKVQSRDIEQIAVEQKPWETVTETDFEWSIVPG
jgi:hypothetical protein